VKPAQAEDVLERRLGTTKEFSVGQTSVGRAPFGSAHVDVSTVNRSRRELFWSLTKTSAASSTVETIIRVIGCDRRLGHQSRQSRANVLRSQLLALLQRCCARGDQTERAVVLVAVDTSKRLSQNTHPSSSSITGLNTGERLMAPERASGAVFSGMRRADQTPISGASRLPGVRSAPARCVSWLIAALTRPLPRLTFALLQRHARWRARKNDPNVYPLW
jgi:hypothetical protein